MKLEELLGSTLLPSLPQVAIRLLEISKDPESDIQEVVDAVKMDPAITVKILKAANSSYFTFRSEITTIERAVPMLGTNVVSSLVLSFSLVDSVTSSGPLAKHYEDYWQQSIVQAAAAETIGQINGEGIACENFLAGLMMDIGRLAMLRTLGEKYLPVLEQLESEANNRSLESLELEAFGFCHCDVGAGLLKQWGLDSCLIDVCQVHHGNTTELKALENVAYYPLIKTTALASAACQYLCGSQLLAAKERVDTLAGELFNFDEEESQSVLEQVREKVDNVADLFSVNVSSVGSPQDLLIMANEQLAQLAIRQQAAMQQSAMEQQTKFEETKQQLETQNEELRQQALYDPLTNVYNRRFFTESLQREIARCRREKVAVGLVMVDVDHFKQLNDNHGHQFGDAVLKVVAKALGEATRDADTVARYGGEEFVVIAHQPSQQGLTVLSERLRRSVESLQLENEGIAVPVTISVGAAIGYCNTDDTAGFKKDLIKVADQLLYKSKAAGRNQVHVDSLGQPPLNPGAAIETPVVPIQSQPQ